MAASSPRKSVVVGCDLARVHAGPRPAAGARCALPLLLLLLLLRPSADDAFRILDPIAGAANATASASNASAYFVAYAPGFVGRVQDPDNPRRFRVNPGSQFRRRPGTSARPSRRPAPPRPAPPTHSSSKKSALTLA